jgi:sucrose-6-phosphate hydrolase SacC (GH32 family)
LPNTNNSMSDVFTPLDGKNVGSQLDQKYDYGSHASNAHRTFFDTKHSRHVLWGSVGGVCKGSDWANMMSFPRVVELDPLDSSRLISFPLPEISTLWANTSTISQSFEVVVGATHRLPSSFGGNQLDLTFGFEANASASRTFGVRVLAPPGTEATRGVNVTVNTTAGSAFATLGGGAVNPISRTDFRVLGDTVDLRILVDHAIVEIFAEGGRTTATAWLCAPLEAIGVEIFNLGPSTLVVKEVASHAVASVNQMPWELAATGVALKNERE